MSKELIEEYNELVQQWNERFSEQAAGQQVNIDNFVDSTGKRFIKFITEGNSEKRKVKHTKDVVGDFASLPKSPPDSGQLSKQELAALLVQKAEDILEQM